MGKRLDRIAAFLILYTGLFAAFLGLSRSVPAAAVITFLTGMLLRRLRLPKGRERMTYSRARAVLDYWVKLPDAEAKSQLAAFLDTPEESLVYLPGLPSSAIGAGNVLSAWKQHRMDGRLIIVSTARADPRAFAYAEELEQPSVEIIDGPSLIRRIRRSGCQPDGMEKPKLSVRRFRRFLSGIPLRRSWRKSMQTGLLLSLFYLLSGRTVYLFLAAALLFLAGLSFRQQRGTA